ncbi:MAG TPA: hypothetical protein VMS22_00880 [Candidatus Eisenbacteria bacterium]|nr:hypothetical protein [Candidatus Eisenbacteria bacterium]
MLTMILRRTAMALLVAAAMPAAAATTFKVDPDAGRNQFTAIFDSAVGERITAVSSQVGCTLTVDEEKLEGSATCSVPLAGIRVDNDDTKSDHFRQWATNKKVDPSACRIELELPAVKLPKPIEPGKAVTVDAKGTFTVCGRSRDDKGAESIHVTVTYVPPATPEAPRLLRIRAHVTGFDRERYGVSPKRTEGWLARVQQLADVVATEGTIDVSLFALDTGKGATP